jgi:hypothetical protein
MARPQIGRFNSLLQALLSLKEPLGSSVLDDYFPTLDLFSQAPELFHLRDEIIFQGAGRGIGAVGVSGRVWIMNKQAGLLSVIDQLEVGSQGTAGLVHMNMTTIGLPADGAGGQSNIEGGDSRDGTGTPGTTPKPGTTVANDTTAAPAVGAVQLVTSGNSLLFPCRIVLRTGYALVLQTDAAGAGQNVVVSFRGYERNIEPSEAR